MVRGLGDVYKRLGWDWLVGFGWLGLVGWVWLVGFGWLGLVG